MIGFFSQKNLLSYRWALDTGDNTILVKINFGVLLGVVNRWLVGAFGVQDVLADAVNGGQRVGGLQDVERGMGRACCRVAPR